MGAWVIGEEGEEEEGEEEEGEEEGRGRRRRLIARKNAGQNGATAVEAGAVGGWNEAGLAVLGCMRNRRGYGSAPNTSNSTHHPPHAPIAVT